MSSDSCHPNGPDSDLLVSLHKLLQAGQRTDAPPRHVREPQLRLPQLPPLHGAFFLTGPGVGMLEGETQAVAVAQASGREDGRRRGEAACVGLLRVGG